MLRLSRKINESLIFILDGAIIGKFTLKERNGRTVKIEVNGGITLGQSARVRLTDKIEITIYATIVRSGKKEFMFQCPNEIKILREELLNGTT